MSKNELDPRGVFILNILRVNGEATTPQILEAIFPKEYICTAKRGRVLYSLRELQRRYYITSKLITPIIINTHFGTPYTRKRRPTRLWRFKKCPEKYLRKCDTVIDTVLQFQKT